MFREDGSSVAGYTELGPPAAGANVVDWQTTGSYIVAGYRSSLYRGGALELLEVQDVDMSAAAIRMGADIWVPSGDAVYAGLGVADFDTVAMMGTADGSSDRFVAVSNFSDSTEGRDTTAWGFDQWHRFEWLAFGYNYQALFIDEALVFAAHVYRDTNTASPGANTNRLYDSFGLYVGDAPSVAGIASSPRWRNIEIALAYV